MLDKMTSLFLVKIPSAYCVVPENIHTPPTEGHWKFQGGGGVKPRNFRGVEGVHGQLLFQRVKKHEKNKQHTIETKHEEILTYVVLKQKIKLLSIEMRFTS